MTEDNLSTITELAEVIAVQNETIRNLTMQLESQHDIITEYELDQEEEEKVTAALANDFLEALDLYEDDEVDEFRDIFSRYFGDVEV